MIRAILSAPAYGLGLAALTLLSAGAFAAPASPGGGPRMSDVRSDVVPVSAQTTGRTGTHRSTASTGCHDTFMYWSTKGHKCMSARDKPMARPPGVSPDDPSWFPGIKGGDPGCMRGKSGC